MNIMQISCVLKISNETGIKTIYSSFTHVRFKLFLGSQVMMFEIKFEANMSTEKNT